MIRERVGFVVIFFAFSTFASKQLELTVFYEALCPDSKNFIEHQLTPVYRKFGCNMVVDFVPFGKAKLRRGRTSLEDRVSCQHGLPECRENQRHACALAKLALKQDQQVGLVACLMDNRAKDNIQQCAAWLGLSSLRPEWVDRCANSTRGKALTRMFADETGKLDPPLDFVPWILFDNKFDRPTFKRALHDLEGVVKERIEEC